MAEIDNVTVRVDAVITDEQYHEAMGAVRAANERMDLLAAENGKLRELVRYMHRCYVRGHDWGPYGAPEKEWVEEQMRELGIEVDG
jgi:hypothetical protein